MCGILGMSRWTPVTQRMFPALAIAMNMRGESAWGVTDGDVICKDTGSILDGWSDIGFEGTSEATPGSGILYHTRMPSVGANTVRNAHPFEWLAGDRRVIGAHNGHISNHWALKNKYTATRNATEVDSEMVIAALAEGTPIQELDGWGTVVWYEMTEGQPQAREMFLSTFSRGDLGIVKLVSGEIVFASTLSSIRCAVQLAQAEIATIYEVKPKTRYALRGDDLYVGEAMPWGEAPLAYASPIVSGSYHASSGGRRSGGANRFCKIKTCNQQTQNGAMLCTDCHDDIKYALEHGLQFTEVRKWRSEETAKQRGSSGVMQVVPRGMY